MNSMPLHPALVHLPLGLAFILPAVAIGFAWALWKGKLRLRAWAILVLLEAVLLGAGLVALKTGQQQEDRVESTVPKAALEMHEAYAEQFLWITGLTLAVAGMVLVVPRPALVRTLSALTVFGTILVAGAALRVGHAGGTLVYVHNAGAAYASTRQAPVQAGQETAAPSGAAVRPADGDD